MQTVEEALARAMQDDVDRRLILSIVGDDDVGRVAGCLHELAGDALNSDIVGCHRLEVSVGVALGLRLADDREVMAKLHGPGVALKALRAVSGVQQFLHATGFPCPAVLHEPACLGQASVTLEEFVDKGEHADAHRPEIRRAMAEALAEQVVRCAGFTPVTGLPTVDLSAVDGLWPAPHNVLFDFARTAKGAEWIDRIARRSKGTFESVVMRPVIGHSDWAAKHFRFDGNAITIVYDWDSLQLSNECRIVGGAAATFTCNWYLDVDRVPRPDESAAFVREYENARGQRFAAEELRAVCAAATYCMAYVARCEHAIDLDGRRLPGSWREALGRMGTAGCFEL